ncbi:MAG TPA: hypothetical protein VGH98_11850 [Gemmatimonadaceae bacterium]|jgi:hypothetical protein
MPVREFVDSFGTEWRAWEITPDAIAPPTRGEDYLADCYQLGWVVMETKRGDRRLRLCPIPRDWHRLSDSALEQLVARGEMLPARTASAREPIADLAVVRSFRYPGGRVWTVSVTPHPTTKDARVLRFSAGARAIDVETWPRDWADLPDEQLIAILRRAAPRGTLTEMPEQHRRRWDDSRT